MAISNLSTILDKKQVTVLELSNNTGIALTTLYRLRDTKNVKNINMMVSGKICKALDITFKELYTI